MTLRTKLSTYGATNGPLYSIGPNLRHRRMWHNKSELYHITSDTTSTKLKNQSILSRNVQISGWIKGEKNMASTVLFYHFSCLHYPLFSIPVKYNFGKMRGLNLTFYKISEWWGSDKSGSAFCISPDSTSSSQPQTAPVFVRETNPNSKYWDQQTKGFLYQREGLSITDAFTSRTGCKTQSPINYIPQLEYHPWIIRG